MVHKSGNKAENRDRTTFFVLVTGTPEGLTDSGILSNKNLTKYLHGEHQRIAGYHVTLRTVEYTDQNLRILGIFNYLENY